MGPRGKGFGTSMVEIRREKMEKHIQASSAAEMEGAREGAADGPGPPVSAHGPWVSSLSLTEQSPKKGNCKKPSSWSLLKTFQIREAEMRSILLF